MEKSIIDSIKSVLKPAKAYEKHQLEINLREAHSLWALLADRYIVIDQLNYTKNFSHDKDYIAGYLYLQNIKWVQDSFRLKKIKYIR